MYSENQLRIDAGLTSSNKFSWRYSYDWAEEGRPRTGDVLTIAVQAKGRLSERAFEAWQMRCYESIADKAEALYESERQRLTQQRDALLEELNREDALMLRKLEKEELMKGVLRWVLGPDFQFSQPSFDQLKSAKPEPISDAATYYEEKVNAKYTYWEKMLDYGEMTRFLHQAIEWENVIYLLYPYFWTDENSWQFRQSLYHDDYVHRTFLRAGAARVVLPIRPGFVERFLSFTETLSLDKTLEEGDPYLTIADEIEKNAQEKYPYTESPNKENKENLVKLWYEYTPTGALDVMEGNVLLPDGDADENE